MPEIDKHSPGAFCWAEVGTVDAARTKAFYSQLFGWSYDEKPAGEFGTYTMVKKEGLDLAGLYEMPPDLIQMGVPPHWMSYIAVTSADEACAKIKPRSGSRKRVRKKRGRTEISEIVGSTRISFGKCRRTLLLAICEAAAHDRSANVAEGELIRVVCASLDCPLPPILFDNR